MQKNKWRQCLYTNVCKSSRSVYIQVSDVSSTLTRCPMKQYLTASLVLDISPQIPHPYLWTVSLCSYKSFLSIARTRFIYLIDWYVRGHPSIYFAFRTFLRAIAVQASWDRGRKVGGRCLANVRCKTWGGGKGCPKS